jgi:undecaprenyl diphosphate synthase
MTGQDVPSHVAIIMDGNGRWAKKRHLPRVFGHRAGMKSVKTVVKACKEFGVKYLSLFAFSTENWQRPRTEVGALMSLLKKYLRKEIEELKSNGVRIAVSGDAAGLPPEVREELRSACDETSSCKDMVLNLCLNYGSRQEIVRAVNSLHACGKMPVTEEDISSRLYTAGMPDPDLLIRTSGEYRVSNFLLWQIAYTELYFTPALWPDFTKKHLSEAIEAYRKRERRFGGI